MLELPLAAESLVPHRLPMRLVDQLLEIEGKNGVVEALVDSNCPLVSAEGMLEKVALVELIAQSYAALKGYLDKVENKPVRQGFLVGIKKFVSLEPVFSGERLRITIETLGELEDFAVAEGQIWRSETLVARGEIKIWIN
jgi:predicted hotdog family 3-hydroxylacyl-ACP dehydratase